MPERVYADGDALIKYGERGDEMYLIRYGKVCLVLALSCSGLQLCKLLLMCLIKAWGGVCFALGSFLAQCCQLVDIMRCALLWGMSIWCTYAAAIDAISHSQAPPACCHMVFKS